MKNEKNISCRKVEKNLIAYIEDALPAALRAEIANHFDACNSCYFLYKKVKATYRVFDQEAEPEINPRFISQTEIKLNEPVHRIIHLLPEPGLLNKIAAAAIIIVSIGLGVALGGHIQIPPKQETTVSLNNSSTINTTSGDYYIVDSGEQSLESIFTKE